MILGSIVLAGGASERMGSPKAALRWGDRSLLLHLVETLLDCTWPVVVVARDEHQELPPLHTESELTYDASPGDGPLAAVATGLRALADRCQAAFVTACDMPFVDDRFVGWLAGRLAGHAGVVPVVGGAPQPLCGIYRVELAGQLDAALARGERRAATLAELPGVVTVPEAELRTFDPELRFARDLDSPEDYRAALELRGDG
ncbi:MAG: molybdenum cofactor guanylyltransferase [Planctomycetes bacterium]|nr:molybdenum cofactor guanylyltransferase [Planctomycetota bacterium]